MFKRARKVLAEIARVAFGPSWVEEEYVQGLIRCGRREDALRAHLAEREWEIAHLRVLLRTREPVAQAADDQQPAQVPQEQ